MKLDHRWTIRVPLPGPLELRITKTKVSLGWKWR